MLFLEFGFICIGMIHKFAVLIECRSKTMLSFDFAKFIFRTNTPARLRSAQVASLLGYSHSKTLASVKSDPRHFYRSANSLASVVDPKRMTSELRHLLGGPLPLLYLLSPSPAHPAPGNSQPLPSSIPPPSPSPIPVLAAPPIYTQSTPTSTRLPLPSSLRTW